MQALFEEIEEQRLWELYCNSINTRLMTGDNRSFDDWKKGSKKEVKTMTKEEILTAEQKSREILKSISPKKKKGGKT